MQQLLQILPALHMREAAGPATSLAEGRIIHSPLPIAMPSQCVQESFVSEQVGEPWEEVLEPFFHLPPDATLIMIQTTDGAPHVANQPVRNPLPSCVQEAAGAVLMTMFLALLSLHTASSGGDFPQAASQATLSHELRSPFAAIKGYTHTLLRYEHRIQPEERREFLQEIDEASSHLASLVDQLIELSQGEDAVAIMRRYQHEELALGYRTSRFRQQRRATIDAEGHLTLIPRGLIEPAEIVVRLGLHLQRQDPAVLSSLIERQRQMRQQAEPE
ncbi:hypothetical protein KSC_107520 [Ktedonobacter sp. SOSP1-52]|nr:hypothetical protein KSC_107520 [Ktedonobacter sp. SOSP1-52]